MGGHFAFFTTLQVAPSEVSCGNDTDDTEDHMSTIMINVIKIET